MRRYRPYRDRIHVARWRFPPGSRRRRGSRGFNIDLPDCDDFEDIEGDILAGPGRED
jgi:hypothetical protein